MIFDQAKNLDFYRTLGIGDRYAKAIDFLKNTDPCLSLHDFRMVRGAQHTNLIFDLVIPYSLVGKQAELKHRIDARVQQEDRKYYTVITFDEPVCRS